MFSSSEIRFLANLFYFWFQIFSSTVSLQLFYRQNLLGLPNTMGPVIAWALPLDSTMTRIKRSPQKLNSTNAPSFQTQQKAFHHCFENFQYAPVDL